MKTLAILGLMLSFASVASAANAPAYNCEAVRKNALEDLRAFCEAGDIDKLRLVDYGFQIEVLEKQCGDNEDASRLKAALNAKVHKQDERTCLDLADVRI